MYTQNKFIPPKNAFCGTLSWFSSYDRIVHIRTWNIRSFRKISMNWGRLQFRPSICRSFKASNFHVVWYDVLSRKKKDCREILLFNEGFPSNMFLRNIKWPMVIFFSKNEANRKSLKFPGTKSTCCWTFYP